MNLGLHVIQYPNGKFGYVGSVPPMLAFVYESEEDLRSATIAGPGIARKIAEAAGRVFRSRVFNSKEAAVKYARDNGFEVKG